MLHEADTGVHSAELQTNKWWLARALNAKLRTSPWFIGVYLLLFALYSGCGSGGRAVVLQPEGQRLDPSLFHSTCPKCPWAKYWTQKWPLLIKCCTKTHCMNLCKWVNGKKYPVKRFECSSGLENCYIDTDHIPKQSFHPLFYFILCFTLFFTETRIRLCICMRTHFEARMHTLTPTDVLKAQNILTHYSKAISLD